MITPLRARRCRDRHRADTTGTPQKAAGFQGSESGGLPLERVLTANTVQYGYLRAKRITRV
jgi:hypothetical protein